ncbi:MAG TPA: hypothetical protein VFY84_04090, partial [Jiangellales bacterium]|nr:hypothetical protein [Jiangellales bacterium]
MSDSVTAAQRGPADLTPPGPLSPRSSGRAGWHRRAGALPLGYLAAIVVVAAVHPFVPQWRWLLVHLLLLGAATNAIVIWSTHFASAVLRVPPARNRRGE